MLTRREAAKLGGAALLAAVGGAAVACTQNALNAAGIVLSAFKQIQPILTELLPSAATTIDKAIKIAGALQTAIKNESPETIDFLLQLISPDGVFNELMNDVGLVTDPAKKKTLTLLLIIAQVALTAVATALHQDVPAIIQKATAKGKSVDIIEKLATSNRLEGMLAKF